MRKVYELVKLPGSRFSPKLWRYRVPVSIDHLIHTIEQHTGAAQPNQLELLKAFLKEVKDESGLNVSVYLKSHVRSQSCVLYNTSLILSSCNIYLLRSIIDGFPRKRRWFSLWTVFLPEYMTVSLHACY